MQFLGVLILCTAIFLGCGKSTGQSTLSEMSVRDQLRIEIDRIKPKLLWCEGGPADTRANELTGQANCGLGDSVSIAGFASLYGHMDFFPYLWSTIDVESGQPFRFPSARSSGDLVDGYSRDQFLGLALDAFARQNGNLLRLVRDYARGHSWQLCDPDSDARCYVTLIMRYAARDALGETLSNSERALDVFTVRKQAEFAPIGYQLFLNTLNAHLHVLSGHPEYQDAINTAARRMPSNLFYAALTGQDISDRLLTCLQKWSAPGLHHTFWSEQNTECEERAEGSIGWELVSLGEYILR